MTESLLDSTAVYINNAIITDFWRTGQTGAIVDVDGNNVYRFIDYINDNGVIRQTYHNEEELKQKPIVAIGFVGFWLDNRNCLGTKVLFEQYYQLSKDEYIHVHESDDDAWDRDLEKEFICLHHLKEERKFIKDSEAIFPYVTESDRDKIKSISENYIKFVRAKRKTLYPPKYPEGKQLEYAFINVYSFGGPAYKCMKWFMIEYDLYPHDSFNFHRERKKESLKGEAKYHHEVEIPEIVKEGFQDFNDGPLFNMNGGISDEIYENLRKCQTKDDQIRYLRELIMPFKDFAETFCASSLIADRMKIIEGDRRSLKELKDKQNSIHIDELTGEPVNCTKLIESYERSIQEGNKYIKQIKKVQRTFYDIAQHGLLEGISKDGKITMRSYLGYWWSRMVYFARHIASVALTFGINIKDVQEQCGVYLTWDFMLPFYVDHKYVTSYDQAQELLDKIKAEKKAAKAKGKETTTIDPFWNRVTKMLELYIFRS